MINCFIISTLIARSHSLASIKQTQKSSSIAVPFSLFPSPFTRPQLLASKIKLKTVLGAVIIRITDISKIRFMIYALSLNPWPIVLPKELSWRLLLDEFLYSYAKDL